MPNKCDECGCHKKAPRKPLTRGSRAFLAVLPVPFFVAFAVTQLPIAFGVAVATSAVIFVVAAIGYGAGDLG